VVVSKGEIIARNCGLSQAFVKHALG